MNTEKEKLKYIITNVKDVNNDDSNNQGIDLSVVLQDYPKYVGHIFVYRNLRFIEKEGKFFVEASLEHVEPSGITAKKDENNKMDDEVEQLMNRLMEQIIHDILGSVKEGRNDLFVEENKENGVPAN